MADDEDFSDPEPLRIEAIGHRSEVTIIVERYLDVENCPRFRESVKEVLATRPRSMAIDASRVMFVDSSGLGALLSARHAVRTEAGLAFRVIDPSPALLRVVEIAGFTELLSGE